MIMVIESPQGCNEDEKAGGLGSLEDAPVATGGTNNNIIDETNPAKC